MNSSANRAALLASAYTLDQLLGDPEWFPHPVRLIGSGITHGERALRHPGQSRTAEFVSGTALTAFLVASCYCVTSLTIRFAYRRSRTFGFATELLFAWTCIASRNLEQEASSVLSALQQQDITLARTQLARIVGRDTHALDASEISRAVIETLAESASDGILAPLFYLALGGVPLGMAYKALNTLDSMIGHADARYFYFGKAAARLDDAANYIPARLTALALCAASFADPQADPSTAYKIWRRDGHLHKSPNAGQPESAIAGALQVRLGGGNTYGGEFLAAPSIGAEFEAGTPAKAQQAIKIVAIASMIGLAAAVSFAISLRRRKV